MSIERGTLLFQTGRYDLAEQEFRGALVEEPQNALAHAMIGMCLLQRKEYQQATDEAQQAIGLRPDWHVGYAALASILIERRRLKEAVDAISQAISFDPFNPAHHGTLAAIRLQQRKWVDALAAADAGLQIDPENSTCVNARGMALVNLGRRDEAGATIQGALSRNPENALAHANQGWALLHSGDHRGALQHFREALRINPELQWAKAGIVEALKARNPIYRLMLRYFLFMSRLSRQMQWGIIIGGYIGYQLLREAGDSTPAIKPIVLPLIIAYVVFAYLTWLASPLFNLMLRINRFGRYALSRDQRVASNWLAACLLPAIGFLVAWLVTADARWLIAAAASGFLSLPITATFHCQGGWPRRTMALYSAALAAIGAAVVASLFPASARFFQMSDDQRTNLVNAFLIGVILSGVVANMLMMSTVKR